ncbi:tetratricopeptide repeat protein [candidate division CSSED10-310 bacterium]|uniref:Tetratricopeptide repeat protein n=1 Tax=candidate division CSSED10-310 bacterium TaxID=2855610 RepID=A0ABV6Z4G7_UNCC1
MNLFCWETYWKKGDDRTALDYFQKMINITTEKVDPHHPLIANACHNIGLIHDQSGASDQAIEYLEKAVAIRLQIHGDPTLQAAHTVRDLANAFRNKGDTDQARRWYSKALSMFTKLKSQQHVQEIQARMLSLDD